MVMANQSLAKNFDFPKMVSSWAGYDSARDKTNVAANVLVRGSQNVYKNLAGNISVRPGQKRQGAADTTASPVSSEFIWNTSLGNTYTLVIANSTLSVVINEVWYPLQTGLTKTRYVFDKWWDNTLKKDDCLFVNGTTNTYMWSGGVANIASSTANTITLIGAASWVAAGFTSTAFSTIGSGTTQFDITNPSGTIFRYTFDGTGTDPLITSATVPIGTYILIQAQNFNAVNNGIFIVTNSGTNFFEVTNASGVAENNKTIGTGFIYTKYTKVLVQNGVLYAYTGGETTQTLTGVVPSSASLVAASLIFQAVVTYPNTPDSTGVFTSDFIKVINNQVYHGSYTSRLIYMSQDTDFTNYVVPNPQIAGSPGLFVMDGTGKGIGVRQGNAHIGFGTEGWAIISFTIVSNNNVLTRDNKIDIKPVALQQAPYAHEFIDNVGDNLIYLGQDQQVRSFGDFNNLFASGYPSLSQEIATELDEENFTGGSLRCIGEFIYLVAPNSGKVYLKQERTTVDSNGNVVAERIWHSPFIWSLTRVDSMNGVVIGFSNATPQIYELWDTNQWHDDSPSDEPLPYTCILAPSYQNNNRRQGLLAFDKLYTEGYLTAGSKVNALINYDFIGSTNRILAVINSITQPAKIFTSSPLSLGDGSLGDNPLGDITAVAGDMDALPKFRNINSLASINCFEYQAIIFSDTVNAQWEIIALATNETRAEQDPTFIINKLRI